MLSVPRYRQSRPNTCWPACVRMILAYHGKHHTEYAIFPLRLGKAQQPELRCLDLIKVPMPFLIQPSTPTDTPALWEMLTYAARMPDDVAANIAAAQADPFLQKYVEGWGKPGDLGVLAVDESGETVGAAWVRLLDHSFHARNHAADNIPELAIGVRPARRGQGIGTALMEALIAACRGRFPALVLSVRLVNPAVHLYERLGFVTVEEIANRVGTASAVMELKLTADR